MAEDRFLKIADLLASGGTLRLTNSGGSRWKAVTEASLEEYRAHHQAENYPEPIPEMMPMFGAFIAKWAGNWAAESVIDLGCGISPALPPYARDIAPEIRYVGLDPLDENPEREYPFISGRLEDLAACGLDRKFGMALFVTSLDHFEDARNALALAGKITGGGRVLIWCGLHDSHLIARNDLTTRISRLCQDNRSFFARTAAFLGLALLTWPRVAWALARRERNLAAGRPLDGLHYHYFTTASLRALLDAAGTVHEFALCPGTNGVFAALTITPETE
jgi:SAM-dependent methyltransferase